MAWPAGRLPSSPGSATCLSVVLTGDAKSSTDAVGAAQQYSGSLGGIGLCQVAVHLSLATPAGHAVIGRRLYLGADWASDDERRTLVGVPDDLAFATKPDLAITLIRQAVAAGVHAQYVTADEVYGSVAFRTACRTLGLAYVVAIPTVRQVTTPDHRRRTCTDAIALVPATAWARMRTGSATKGAKDYDWALLAIEPDDTPTSDTSAAYLLRSSSARVAGWWVEGVLDSAAYPRSGRILRSVGDVKGRVAIAERRPEGPPLTCPVESGHWAPARGSRLVTRAF